MKSLNRMLALVVFAVVALALAACGGAASPATLSDIPSYPNATALQPGQNPIADTLAQNVQQAGAMGAKLDQKIFTLPGDTTWDKVKGFYSDKLGASGWSASNLPIPDNDMFKMTLWTRGSQSLTVAQLTDPASKDNFLLFSLSSQ
jgi:hypothetical protein